MKKKNIRQCILLISGIILLSLVSSKYFFRIDLTAEKRYTLSAESRQILRQLDEPVYFDIYLSGDIPAGFRKLRNSIREMLDDFEAYSGNSFSYTFTDPSGSENAKAREQHYVELENMGLRPVNINKKNKDGSISQQIIFPGALVSYKGRQLTVNFLRNNPERSAEANLNSSIEMLEYELIKAVYRLSADSIGKIAFTIGHGESNRAETYDLAYEFANYYDVERKLIDGNPNALDSYRAVVIVKPTQAFDEKDKFVIDRYIMNGGKVMWLIDAVNVNTDSLFTTGMTFALASELNLEDQLFTYGVRINPALIQDAVHNDIPVTTGSSQVTLAPWLYYPLIAPSPEHTVTRNLNPVWLRYAGDIDTVGMDANIRKTVLLQSSPLSRVRHVPFMINLNEVAQMPVQEQFNKPGCIVAVLLEGRFPSVFRSRNTKGLFPSLQEKQVETSTDTKMLVVADGDIARNDVRNTPQGAAPSYPLGYDRYTERTFGNKEFLTIALNYLTDDIGLMKLRNREFQLRLLNGQKAVTERFKWQIINIALPILIILSGGLAYGWRRRHKYGHAVGS
jgi:ABC-2 type transport system permease protein